MKYDGPILTIYQNRVISFTLTWRDAADALVDVTGYGAIFVVKEQPGGQELIRADDSGSEITVGTTDGLFTIQVVRTKTENLKFKRGVWEFTVFPTSGSPETAPLWLVGGPVMYKPSLASLS